MPQATRMVERHIKSREENEAERRGHEAERFRFRRNQTLGLVLLAIVICVVWLLRTNPAWIFPAGWWRW